ncbi:type II secretion system protein GspL [Escherichia ruysiae]|uniref:type II secretion system protein GspL n=1 Tax=Escherichia ruysiae TaxID=2608867 RepID=UPI001583BD48|nr:type II secretion system protein GspL [Escherichia ruysiae]MBY7191317.1 type II secretion system protein GspL [Escherichia ruysiae]MBY7277610.1 type II secretion system protein GspL [Escherichia ruysiae]
MPESLMVIRSSSTLRKQWEWMTYSADSVSSVHTLTDDLPLESLADQPGAGNVHLLIPPEGLLYRSLTLPNAKYKLTAQTLQWLAEETLPDTSQNWHWTVVDKQNDRVEVIGIQSEKLSRYLDRLHTAGLNVTRVLPDGCYLPWKEGSWTLVNQQTSWLIRSAAHAFNELDERWLQHLATQFSPENVICFGTAAPDIVLVDSLIQHAESPALRFYSANHSLQHYDMLHGVFRKQKTVSRSGKWLARLAVSSLIFAILSFAGSRGIVLWQTLGIEDQLQQQQQETWQQYFPQIKRTHNFRFYFKQQLAQQYPEAVPLLHHLQTLLLEHPELQLMEANYSQKQKSLILKISSKNEGNIDRFCELTQSWLPMEKTEKDPVSGVWTVRSAGK